MFFPFFFSFRFLLLRRRFRFRFFLCPLVCVVCFFLGVCCPAGLTVTSPATLFLLFRCCFCLPRGGGAGGSADGSFGDGSAGETVIPSACCNFVVVVVTYPDLGLLHGGGGFAGK
jgi:hypothetical protein